MCQVEQPKRVKPRRPVIKKWILHHKIETTAVFVVLIGIIVITVMVVGRSDENGSAVPQSQSNDGETNIFAPTSSPPNEPYDPDPSTFDSPIMTALEQVTDPSVLYDQHTPQFRAADWLISIDPLKLQPNSPNLLQRYALATFYMATGGGLVSKQGWTSCSAIPPETIQGDASASGIQCVVREGKVVCASKDAFETCSYTNLQGATVQGKRFLSPVNECEWYGVTCINGTVFDINTGTCARVYGVFFCIYRYTSCNITLFALL